SSCSSPPPQRFCPFSSPSVLRHPNYPLVPYTTLFRSTPSAGFTSLATRPNHFIGVSFPPHRILLLCRRSSRILPLPEQEQAEEQIGRDTSELQSPYDLVCRLLLEKKTTAMFQATDMQT